jgi:hypothetical protein
MLTNSIILAISRRDTLRPLGITFWPFANSVRDTKHHKRCSERSKETDVHIYGKENKETLSCIKLQHVAV